MNGVRSSKPIPSLVDRLQKTPEIVLRLDHAGPQIADLDNPRRHRINIEVRGIDFPQLVPPDRGRNDSPGQRPKRVDRGHVLPSDILLVVQENLSLVLDQQPVLGLRAVRTSVHDSASFRPLKVKDSFPASIYRRTCS